MKIIKEFTVPLLIVVISTIVLTSIIIFLLPETSSPTGAFVLPTDAIKFSDCTPKIGEHWAHPDDLPFGPYYLVGKGNVVGIEYKVDEDELEENTFIIDGLEYGETVILPALDMTYDHVELTYLPRGHPGLKEPHYDIHIYLISKEERERICLR